MQDQPSDRSSEQSNATSGRRRIVLALAGIALFVAAAWIGTVPLAGHPSSLVPGGGTFPGDHGTGPRVGDLAPDFAAADASSASLLSDLDGRPVRLRDFAGRPVWIVFWATWCTPCQQEAADIEALRQAHRDDDLAILAIDIQEPTVAVRDYVRRNALDYAIAVDPTAAVMDRYGHMGLPAHVFVDRGGVIHDRYLGQMTRPQMEAHLVSLLAT